MQKKILLALFLCGTFHSYSQKLIPDSAFISKLRSQWTFNTGVGNFGIGREFRVSNKWTLTTELGLGWNKIVYKTPTKYHIDLGFPAAYAAINARFYYNINKRASAGKNTINNSANYFGAQLRISTYPIGQNYGPDLLIGAKSFDIHWGIQRSLGKGWLFDTNIGVGAVHNSGTGLHLYPAFNIRFAKIIFARRSRK
jgi:hypothetical protein